MKTMEQSSSSSSLADYASLAPPPLCRSYRLSDYSPEFTANIKDYIEIFYQAHRVPVSKKRLHLGLELREFLYVWENYSKVMEWSYQANIPSYLNLQPTKVWNVYQFGGSQGQLYAAIDCSMKTQSDPFSNFAKFDESPITVWRWLILVPVDEYCQLKLDRHPIVYPRSN